MAYTTWDTLHPEQRRKRDAAYYRRHRSTILARQRAYAAERREAEKQRAAQYRIERRDAYLEQQANYREAHRQERLDLEHARRARKTGAFVERVYRSVVFKRDHGLCGECGIAVDPANWHLDHIIPLARGGEHSYANTQVTHPACNLKKGARL